MKQELNSEILAPAIRRCFLKNCNYRFLPGSGSWVLYLDLVTRSSREAKEKYLSVEEEDEDDLECYDKEIDYVNPDLLSCEKVRVQRFSYKVNRCVNN